ncbi:MAG: PAS domain S-box protein [Deltaproteobacteria bacterium]|nr:PAS domain S-box protein [Deltaproteobacteria bacterium]
MTRLLVHQLEYLLFIEGLFLVASAVMAEVLRREEGAPPWGWFVVFALSQGVGHWLPLMPLASGWLETTQVARELLLIASFAALLQFGRLLERDRSAKFTAIDGCTLGALLAFGVLRRLASLEAAAAAAAFLCGAGGAVSVWRSKQGRPGFRRIAASLAAYTVVLVGALGFEGWGSRVLFNLSTSDSVLLARVLRACGSTWLAWAIWRHARLARKAGASAQHDALLGRRFSARIGAAETKRETSEAIAGSEDRLQRIFEGAPDGIVVFEAETGRILLGNPAFARLLGYEQEELPGKLVTRRTARRVQEQLASGSGPGESFLLGDSRLRRKDGTSIYVEDTGTFLRFQGRRCVVAFVRDVSERKRAEEELRVQQALLFEQKEFSDNLLRGCAVAAFVLGPDHKILFWNRACEELTLLPASEVIGTDLQWKAFYPTERPCLADFVLESSVPGPSDGYYDACVPSKLLPDGLHAQRWFKNRAGEDRYVVFDAAPIRNSQGELVGAIETLQDMTDRQRAEEERALLAAALEQAGEVIVVSDAEGRIRYANPVFQEVTGYAVPEVIGRTHRAWKAGAVGIPGELLSTLEAGETWTGRLASRRKNGTAYDEDVTISPVRDSSRKITHFVGVSRDVSKEVQLERQLAVAQKFEALGTLAGGIAHDFNNMLAVIIGYTEMALDELPEGGRPRRSLEHVLSAGERARDLVRQILAFSRRSEPGSGPVRVAEVVEEALDLCRASLPANVEIVRRIAAGRSLVAAEPTQLHQVIMNLCANAGQAMAEKGGVLTATLEDVSIGGDSPTAYLDLDPGEYVRLRVSDTGCGIDPSILHRIFEPFFTTKGVGEGTGMGLAVVHGIVRATGGEIEVESRIDEGTTFTVYLPKTGRGAEEAPSPAAPDPARGEERILFVEDEPGLIELGERLLTQLGYRVTTASRGDEALERFREGPDEFDLVITDQGMPGMRGIELARRIHEERPQLPILLCSGYSPMEDPDILREAGVRAVLSKPVPVRDLARAIRGVLSAQPEGGLPAELAPGEGEGEQASGCGVLDGSPLGDVRGPRQVEL